MFVRMSESYSSMYGHSNAIQAHHSLLQWRISDSSITLLIKAPPGLYLNNFEPSSANMDYPCFNLCSIYFSKAPDRAIITTTNHQPWFVSQSWQASPKYIMLLHIVHSILLSVANSIFSCTHWNPATILLCSVHASGVVCIQLLMLFS